MIIRAFIKRRFTFILLLVIPILIILSFYYLIKSTADDVEVPIVFVDSADQPFVHELIEELGAVEPFRIELEKEVPWDQLMRGEIEAVFHFKEDILNQIHDGDSNELITWYRHEQSLFDGLIKEKLASTMVNYIVRAEAANVITYYDEFFDWEEAYMYGLRYLGPEPIFQMRFQSYEGSVAQDDSSIIADLSFPRLIVWLYVIILFSLLAQTFITWHKEDIFKRLKLIPYSIFSLQLTWLIFVISVGTILAFIILNAIHFNLNDSFYDPSLFIMDVLAIIVTAILVLLGTKIFYRKQSFIAFVLTYTISSIIIFLLIDIGLLNEKWWMYSFIPTWLLS